MSFEDQSSCLHGEKDDRGLETIIEFTSCASKYTVVWRTPKRNVDTKWLRLTYPKIMQATEKPYKINTSLEYESTRDYRSMWSKD